MFSCSRGALHCPKSGCQFFCNEEEGLQTHRETVHQEKLFRCNYVVRGVECGSETFHASTFSSHVNQKHKKAHSKKILEGKSVAEDSGYVDIRNGTRTIVAVPKINDRIYFVFQA